MQKNHSYFIRPTSLSSIRLYPQTKHKLLVICAFAINTSSVYASGIFVDTQNGAGTANAFAGASAVAEDASTVYFNPAGMSKLTKNKSFTAAMSAIQAKTTFNNQGSTKIAPIVPLGNQTSDIERKGIIPTFFYAQKVSANLQLGLGLSPVYGSEGSWSNQFIGRYQGVKTEIVGININPAIAIKMNDIWSLGIGLNYLKANATITKNFPLVAGSTYIKDVENIIDGEDTGLGYNLGVLAQITPSTRVGLTYRSKIKIDLIGEAKIAPELAAVIKSFPSNVQIELPDTASLALVHNLNHDWQILADASWFGWSSVPAIVIENQNDGSAPIIETLNLKNNWRIGLGANYRINPQWQLGLGVALDNTVVPDAASRSVRLPDNDRTWLSVGANYRLSEQTTINLGYAHVFVKDGDVDRQTTSLYDKPTPQYLRGTYQSNADIVSVQLDYNFN